MKISLASRSHGHVLVIAVIMLAIIGIDLASYLKLVRAQNLANTRSLAWNRALAAAESGVEEAMAHLNKNGNSVNNTNVNLGVSDWTFSGGRFMLSRTNGETRYSIAITSNAVSPTLYSTGYVSLAGMQLTNTWVKRVVQIKTTSSALLVKSLVAKYDIDLKGNNVYSDSYDSTDGRYSTNGVYYGPWAKDNGDMATNTGLTNSIHGGNATIYGKVATGPGGSVYLGPSGVVGDKAWVNAGNVGIQNGHYTDDMNVAFPSVAPPFTSAPSPTPGNWQGTNHTYLIDGSGNWMMTSLSVSGNQSIMVKGNVDAVLYITGDFSMSGQSTLTVSAGASLKVYVGGNVSLTGQGIYNLTGSALKCQFYGLPSCTDWKMSGNPDFTGFLYAPDADFTSTGNSIYYGSVVCKTAKFTGNASFHYDEALGRFGPSRGAVPIDWNEL